MGVRLILAPEAEQDLSEAYDWYEDRRTGLGEEFLSCVEACSEAIRRASEIRPFVYECCRRALARGIMLSCSWEDLNFGNMLPGWVSSERLHAFKQCL